ncbi:MAG: hypothetical protein BAA02_02935 [Paenibacillaceae bacterium ZCTH02-B3]|nr:MAG: hypothetical protein BAA02_02935 [Paenibacillaceae bacterium ZCTH02-B3]
MTDRMEKAKAFLEAVSADENLARALSAIKSREELLAFAARHGHDLTEQDLKDVAKIGSVFFKQKAGEPLSDEELELVSGGFVEWIVIAVAAVAYVAAGGVVAGVYISKNSS